MPPSTRKIEELHSKMEALGIQKKDIEESFVRASGKGGQHVNKVSTCVVLKHVPSGITVKCEEERSQSLNRFLGLRRLVEKIEEIELNIKSKRQQKIEKIKRQKRKRSKRAKEKVLKAKKIQGEKKALRNKPPRPDEN